jgi:hypothetical protein
MPIPLSSAIFLDGTESKVGIKFRKWRKTRQTVLILFVFSGSLVARLAGGSDLDDAIAGKPVCYGHLPAANGTHHSSIFHLTKSLCYRILIVSNLIIQSLTIHSLTHSFVDNPVAPS